MFMTQKTGVVIVAAGSGSRFGDPIPKQYHMLGGKSILAHCIECFARHTDPGLIQVVYNPAHQDWYESATATLDKTGLLPAPVTGGDTRQQSVLNGLRALEAKGPDIVLIHDAARPGISDDVIDRVMTALQTHPGAIPTLPVADTIKQTDRDGVITKTIARETLQRAQTPQGFDFKTVLDAHQKFEGQEFTDDAALLEAIGLDVICVAGTTNNDKITHRDDFGRAQNWANTTDKETAHMSQEEYRAGTGFDVHRFAPGDHCILCGVKVPHSARLEGHSDADVGLHTLTDAILGAIGAGDIGQHFPPSDMQWKGAASDIFLRHAADLVRKRGGRIVNVDVTLICERPKIGPHTPAMRQKVAEILGIDVDRVNVKATTTERLGFTGREEGIAAQAVVSVALPIN
ncbi:MULTISPECIES: bifunctional 2-C-methyl-D-erythritol 4-phosphate cytidylyltransferase/2-C-methyl-D-erythritol 2,4-cyclodiphosphate synthase [Thalassospira]|uniref:Bifunctional enzyme IspD/IspF n=2 Tax=Thalassospira tepidiphila TaxID=393657 RepID=A0A853KZQ0_9PROT|nr:MULTISPECIES: bifunctional 2-C-methyl-D-erythritol 4-phosphate cytidylyltransferase/2-C-methyl-D-erythritol 2,4-cyclodiphosphate synthase [Thalassospira]MBO6578142.1 bifunctional 2-C-methyl-D-erythritol 4-phosphate cytidylyltransferase/2-C-methyl-D-erythritol 2,4-cyclodiphosphate synthase [Thalassospira sp.]MBO6819364.1 bifunctional 2-C-methyl-D-erythritol 4-phosphate cytidylyltransferase/2-C-methyl-D-erythritol 2,4-cyclodiphosphate synthase [Thalassospira sp.]MBO6889937.1 bifunctional 2-C-me